MGDSKIRSHPYLQCEESLSLDWSSVLPDLSGAAQLQLPFDSRQLLLYSICTHINVFAQVTLGPAELLFLEYTLPGADYPPPPI